MFMHVAAVGRRVVSALASGASEPEPMPARCTQKLGASCEKPSRGVLGHAVTKRRNKRWSRPAKTFPSTRHSILNRGVLREYPPLYTVLAARSVTFSPPPVPEMSRRSSAGANTRRDSGANERPEPAHERAALLFDLPV